MLKDFLVRKMIESKLKDVPPEQKEMIIGMVEKNPMFFQTIALEIKQKIDGGMDQMAATMEVMRNHEAELKQIAESK
jgi:hypothetical protein